MEKVHSATSPFWAKKRLVSFLGLAFAIFLSAALIYLIKSGLDQFLAPWVAKGPFMKQLTIWVALLGDVILSTVLYTAIIRIFKELNTKRYPGTFVYCYELNNKSKTEERFVVGCFVLDCEEEGEMIAKGESYIWQEDLLKENTKEEWKSLHVGASTVGREIICYILYQVCSESNHPHSCTHVLLGFVHKSNVKGQINSDSVYTGHMQSLAAEDERPFNHSLAYAERLKGRYATDEGRLKVLRANGPDLIHQLKKRLASHREGK